MLRNVSRIKLIVYVFLSVMSNLNGIFIAIVTGKMINIATGGSTNDLLFILAVSVCGLLIFTGLRSLLFRLKNAIIHDFSLELKVKTFENMFRSENLTNDGNLSLLINDAKMVETKGVINELEIIKNSLLFTISLTFSIYLDVGITLLFLIASLSPVLISKIFSPIIKRKSDAWSSHNSEYTEVAEDYLNGKETIVNYQSTPFFLKKFEYHTKKLEDSLSQLNNCGDLSKETTILIANILMFVVAFGYGIYQVLEGYISLGMFVSILQLSNFLANPIILILRAISEKDSAKSSWDKFLKINEIFPSIEETKVMTDSSFQKLELKQVCIQKGGENLFENMSTTIKSGDKVLVSAPSGFGKTTFLRTLMGTDRFTCGHYYFNNQLVNEKNISQLNRYFSYVRQTPYLFDDSILFNITLGHEYTDEKILSAVKNAQLENLITNKGLEYIVGKQGNNLSGGQKQRIEIARAFLAEKPILLADEITSALDQSLSDKISDALMDSDFTVIEVAHKTSTQKMKKYDQVIYLDR